MSTIIHPMFFSTSSWLSFMVWSVLGGSNETVAHGGRNRRIDGAAAKRGLPDVPRHQQHAAEEQDAAHQPDRVEGIGRLHAFNERISERAVRIHRAPHEALHDAGDPHRSDV